MNFVVRLLTVLFLDFGFPVTDGQLQAALQPGFPVISGTNLLTEQAIRFYPESENLVVVFLSSRCPCSQSHEHALAQMAQEFKEFRFVGVVSNGDERLTAIKEHFEEAKLPFGVIRDENLALANAFGALKTPHVYVFKSGKQVFQGGVDDSQVAQTAKQHYLKDALTQLRKGLAPDPDSARTLGCLIRR